jgi:hypothetical protein
MLAMHTTLLLVALVAADHAKSNEIVMGEFVYQLAVDDNKLALLSKKSGTGEISSRTLNFKIPANGRVSELRLEPWLQKGGGLCGVVEVTIGDKYRYACITLSAPGPSAGYDSAAAVFLESPLNYAILAVNGTFDGDSVLALLGKLELQDRLARVVTKGVIYLDDCPAPPTRGSLSKFDSETELDPKLRKLFQEP